MLASSPLRFPILRNVTRVYLDHGGVDDVVPPWNAEEMAAALRAQAVNLEYHLYPGLRARSRRLAGISGSAAPDL
jgi:dipeptidyl aminopeptidase/acylaminoacyl peptidase